MYCTNCGEQLDKKIIVCPYCGTKTHRSSSYHQHQQHHPMAKSKIAAGLLGIFFGMWGVHNFYLKRNSQGVAQLLLGTIGFIIFIGPVISAIWGFVEGILILTGGITEDGDGVPLRD